MGLDIYFQEDIVRVLAALARANARAMRVAISCEANSYTISVFEHGYQSALDDVATAFRLVQLDCVLPTPKREVVYHE